MEEPAKKMYASARKGSVESSVKHQFVRNSASMEGVALDQTSAHARTDSLETAVNKITDLVLATRRLGIECVIISYRVWCARASPVVLPLEKPGETRVNAALLSQNLVTEDFSQIFAAKHVKTLMSARRFQRSVLGEDVSTPLEATGVNVPREKNLTQTLRNVSIKTNALRFPASAQTADVRIRTGVLDVFVRKDTH